MSNRITYLKFGLFIFALFIASILYFSARTLTIEVKKNEKDRIVLWSQALVNKSNIIGLTKDLFDRIKIDEKNKVELWSDAMQILLQNETKGNVDLLIKIISSNRNIPIILVNSENKVTSTVNFEGKLPPDSLFVGSLKDQFSKHAPLKIISGNAPVSNLYYQDSRIYKDLQVVMNEYVESLILDIVENSVSVPVLVADSAGNKVLFYGNIQDFDENDSLRIVERLTSMAHENSPIPVLLYGNTSAFVYYEDSYLLNIIQYIPIFVIGILTLFVLTSFLAFNSSRKFDENQLWVGMSKETAHQLGTPISSLMAWVELLRMDESQHTVAEEIDKDVERLKTVADRFSKIGSAPKLIEEPIVDIIHHAVNYMKRRTSSEVLFSFNVDVPQSLKLPLNIALFEWTIENLIRNSVDAMAGTGQINITIFIESSNVVVEFSDTGKGIPRRKHKTVFKPGYSTKKRGWGLGLTLTKRIIEEYHKGKIYVKKSEIGTGTTFRILLPKNVTNRK